GKQIQVNGEGTFVNALASNLENKTILVLTNYDPDNRNTELVPITVSNLINGTYTISTHLLDSNILTNTVTIENGQYVNKIPMPANSVMAIEIIKN
ncbi:MAG: hypothetical protein Q7R95_06775, partial [bacterium]|nr:hypothetical protein [bacterium]